jgi:GDPmannose 4,6-dehydratase
VNIVECDLCDPNSVNHVLNEISPKIIFNLSGQSSVGQSHWDGLNTMNSNILPVINILEFIRLNKISIKFYQASSSEIFGNPEQLPITINSSQNPNSPYGVSKSIALKIIKCYRDAYNIFACSGILFNHESYLRDNRFFLKKLIKESVEIKKGKKSKIKLGNLNVYRDFGSAEEYMNGVIKIINHNEPKDFIICTGKATKLEDIARYVLNKLNLDHDVIEIDKMLQRNSEIQINYGDNSVTEEILNWSPSRTIYSVIDEMIDKEFLLS